MRSILFLPLLAPIVHSAAIGNRDSTNKADLHWEPCELDFPPSVQETIQEPFDCATISVPLDYTDEASESLQLQLVKVNATAQPAKGRVVFLARRPWRVGILRDEYDIIGFDPRGVGRTIPFSCAAESANLTKRDYSLIDESTDMPMVDAWSILQNKAWHEAKAFTERCYEAQKETGRFLSTAFVARDLLAISEAVNDDGLLRLWGRSYGTIVGQTFAAMFPDRIERLLLDSVVLARDYYDGTWHSSTRDTRNSIAHFFKECIDAGPEMCPIANFTGADATPKSLMEALVESLNEVKAQNLSLSASYPASSFFESGEGLPVLGELKFGFLSQAYRPDQYPVLLGLLNSTFHRDFQALLELDVNDQLNANTSTAEIPWSLGTNAFHGVACVDSGMRVHEVEDMYNMVQAGVTSGGGFADRFPYQLWPCAQWKFDAAERFEGSFRGIETRNPVLFVNSPYDPITPLSGAYDAASGFPGSRLLVHEGHGHGLANHPSLCTLRAIGKYFSDGTLPSVGAKCTPAKSGWDLTVEAATYDGTVAVTEEVRDDQERKMMESIYGMVLGGFKPLLE
ncbi:hypothetical protein Q7P37_006641 [Cladosporium fusiforme]